MGVRPQREVTSLCWRRPAEVLGKGSYSEVLRVMNTNKRRGAVQSICNSETNSVFSRLDAGQEGGPGHPVPEHRPTSWNPTPTHTSLIARWGGGGIGTWPGQRVTGRGSPSVHPKGRPFTKALPFFESWELAGWVCSHQQCSRPGSLK